MAKVIIPTPLRRFTENQPTLVTQSTTVFAAIEELGNKYPGLAPHLFNGDGQLKNFIRLIAPGRAKGAQLTRTKKGAQLTAPKKAPN